MPLFYSARRTPPTKQGVFLMPKVVSVSDTDLPVECVFCKTPPTEETLDNALLIYYSEWS